MSEQKEGKRKWCVNHLSKLPGNICTFGLVIYEPFFVYFMLFQALLNIMFLDCHSLYSLPIISRAQTILAIFWQSYIWQNFCQMLCHIALAQKKISAAVVFRYGNSFFGKKNVEQARNKTSLGRKCTIANCCRSNLLVFLEVGFSLHSTKSYNHYHTSSFWKSF